MNVSILLFMTEEDTENARRARALKAGLEKAGWNARVVNRLSNNLDELLLAAQYRVVHLPRWVVLLDDAVWRDANTMPTYNEATQILAQLHAQE